MNKFLTYLLAGFLGGVIRGLVGFVKNKNLEMSGPQFLGQRFDLLLS